MLEILGLKRYFGNRCVLDIERLTMESHGPHVIVGHNGAGKTTLLRIIAGLESYQEGTVQSPIPISDRVFCPQKPYMFRGTVEDNLVKGLKFRGLGVNRSRLRELTARLGLDPLVSRRAKALSAGETQRVALARALVIRPRLLLLDEPTASVDPHGAEVIEDEHGRRVSEETMVIVATHFGEMAQRPGTRIHRLEEGRLTAPEVGNVFEAEFVQVECHTWARLRAGARIRCVTDRVGRGRLAIPASDIVISKQRLDSSMANVLEGVISGLRRFDDRMELTVEAGVPLRAVITPESFERLGINVGSPVVASFKATSVRVL